MDLLATMEYSRMWYAIPLIVSISLVYGATRHEEMKPILLQACHAAWWIVAFMLIIFGILFAVSWFFL